MSDTPRTDAVCFTPIMRGECTPHKWERIQELSRQLEREVAELREALVWMLPQIEASLAAIDVARNDPYVKQSIERCAKYRQLLAQGG